MKINQQAIYDPLGNEIHLAGKLNKLPVCDSEVYDDLTDVISAPSLLIQGTDSIELHYYRSIGWNTNILISAKKKGRHWMVTKCALNPSTEKMSKLIQSGVVINYGQRFQKAS